MPQEEMLELKKCKKNFIIGIPKEATANESRIALTPQAVELLVSNGYQILLERDAGKGANYSNELYSEAGAQIFDEKPLVYEQSDIILKVAPFNDEEIALLKERQIIISSFIVMKDAEKYIRSLMAKKINAIAFEYMRDIDGCYPVVQSMCEIAGGLSIAVAAEYLSNSNNGKGVWLGGVTGISPAEVVILGANTAGEFAARAALGLGATVKIFDSYMHRLIEIQRNIGHRVFTSNYHPPVLQKALKSAEVVIGALQLVEESSSFYVPEEMVREMKQGAIIIDLSIDQGGCFETSQHTTHAKPTFKKHGVTHYCVPNITSRVARTSSIALSNIFAPILLKMGDSGGFNNHLKLDVTVRQGVYLYSGILTNSHLAKHFDIPYKNIDLLMAAF